MTRVAACMLTVCAAIALAAGCSEFKFFGAKKEKESDEALAAKDPNTPKAPPAKINATTYFAAGQLHEREGSFYAAAEQYFKATQADHNYTQAYNRLGIVYDRLRLYDQAEVALLHAISISPDQAHLRNNLAFHYMLQNNLEHAEAVLRDALQVKPDYARARMNLGVVLTRMGRTDEAVAAFAVVLPMDAAYYNVGLLCANDRRLNQARGAFVQALALNPANYEAKLQLDKLGGPQTGDAMPAATVALTGTNEPAPTPPSATPIGEPQRAPGPSAPPSMKAAPAKSRVMPAARPGATPARPTDATVAPAVRSAPVTAAADFAVRTVPAGGVPLAEPERSANTPVTPPAPRSAPIASPAAAPKPASTNGPTPPTPAQWDPPSGNTSFLLPPSPMTLAELPSPVEVGDPNCPDEPIALTQR